MRAVLGIDPGKKGAACLITEDRRVFVLRFMYADSAKIRDTFFDWNLQYKLSAAKEVVGPRPNEGVVSVATFARNNGLLDGLLLANFVDCDDVQPKIWQYEFELGGKQFQGDHCRHEPYEVCEDCEYAARKRAHKEKALVLPEFAGIVVTLDMADAMLIALYKWRKVFGGLTNGKGNRKFRPGRGVVRIQLSKS